MSVVENAANNELLSVQVFVPPELPSDAMLQLVSPCLHSLQQVI